MGDGVANNLNDASHLPHLAESFLVLHSTSCNLAEGPSRVIALLHRRSSGHRLDQGYGSVHVCMYYVVHECMCVCTTCTTHITCMSCMYTTYTLRCIIHVHTTFTYNIHTCTTSYHMYVCVLLHINIIYICATYIYEASYIYCIYYIYIIYIICGHI